MSRELAAIEAISLLQSRDRLCETCDLAVAEYRSSHTSSAESVCTKHVRSGVLYDFRAATDTEEALCKLIAGWVHSSGGVTPVANPNATLTPALRDFHMGSECNVSKQGSNISPWGPYSKGSE